MRRLQTGIMAAGIALLCALTQTAALTATKVWNHNFGGGSENAEISPDGKTVAVGVKSGSNAEIRIIDIGDPKKVFKTLYLAQNCSGDKCNEVESMAWSGDGKFLAAGGNGTGLKIWEVATGKEVWKKSGGEHDGMSAHPSGSIFYMANGGGLTVVEIPSLKLGSAEGTMGCGVNSVDFSSDGKTMVVGSCGGGKYAGGKIAIWSVNGINAERLKMVKTPGSVKTTRVTPDGKYLITAEGGCGYVRIRDRDLNVLKSIATPGGYSKEYLDYGKECSDGGGSYVDHAEMSPDGKYFATQATTSNLNFYSIPGGEKVMNTSSVANGEYMCWRGDKLLIVSSGGSAVLFKMSAGGATGLDAVPKRPAKTEIHEMDGSGRVFNLLGMRLSALPEAGLIGLGPTFSRGCEVEDESITR